MAETQPRVLVVDDEPGLLKSLVAFLEDEDFIVYSASTGEMALEFLRKEQVDAVVIDMRLPGIDGNEVILAAQEMRDAPHFLIHTGSMDYQLPEALKQLNFLKEHIFLKPLADMGILAKAIKNLVKN